MFYVYCYRHIASHKHYVGQTQDLKARHAAHVNSSKRGDGYVLHRAMAKHGVGQFEHFVLRECETLAEVLSAEIWWVKELSARVPGGYNLTDGGEGTLGQAISEKTRAAVAEANRRRVWSDEARARSRALNTDKKMSAEAIEKTAAAQRGRPKSDEHRALLSAAKTGTRASEETRAKMSRSSLGKKKTKEHTERMAASHRGMKRSPEARANMAAAQRRRRASKGV